MSCFYTGPEGMMVVQRIAGWLRSDEASDIAARAPTGPEDALADAVEGMLG